MSRTMPGGPEAESRRPEDLPHDQAADLSRRMPSEAAEAILRLPRKAAALRISSLHPSVGRAILKQLPPRERDELIREGPPKLATWMEALAYPEGTVGRLMEAPIAVFPPEATVHDVVEHLRELVRSAFVTYCWVVDQTRRLVGVVAMRELLLSTPETLLAQVMTRDPFFLRADQPLKEAMTAVVTRHYPVYPVCDPSGVLVGAVRGQVLFQTQAFEISAQPGAMVGVEKEERSFTPWPKSFRSRHPWLQLNLLTAFAAGAVVSLFQDTIDRIVILAVFLPILAGQSGNTGCQSLAVMIRGLTLGDLTPRGTGKLISKEAVLGFLNGSFVGLSAGLGMYILATVQSNPHALRLALVVLVAMIASCVVSGISGALVPLGLKRLGADPATASSIFLTTATDVVSMGVLLGLATVVL